MLGIGETELLIIVVFGFLLFGPDKLPQMGRTLGRALRQFRETQQKMTSVVQTEVIDPMAAVVNAPDKPVKPSKAAATDEDADVDDGSAEAAPARKETFAERRARLAAEKAAKEGEASGQDAPAGEVAAAPTQGDDTDAAPAAESGSPAAGSAETAGAAEAVAEPEPVEDAKPTTADLYARRPRKRSVPTDDTAEESPAAPEAQSAPETDAPADAPAQDAPAADAASEEGGER